MNHSKFLYSLNSFPALMYPQPIMRTHIPNANPAYHPTYLLNEKVEKSFPNLLSGKGLVHFSRCMATRTLGTRDLTKLILMDFYFKDIWEWSQREYNLLGLAAEDDTVILGLEPLHGVLLGQAVREPNVSNLAAPVLDIHARTAKDNIEVHSVDTYAWIVPEREESMHLRDRNYRLLASKQLHYIIVQMGWSCFVFTPE